MQAVDCADQPPELRLVQQVVDVALAGEELFGQPPGGRRQFLGLGKWQPAFGNETK